MLEESMVGLNKKSTFLVGDCDVLQNMQTVKVLPVFSDAAVSFLDDLSQVLRKDKRSKDFQDILSYAFWIRRASVMAEKKHNNDKIKAFLEKYKGQTIFLFGFTYMIWQYFYKKLKEIEEYLPLGQGVMIHGGGCSDTFEKSN